MDHITAVRNGIQVLCGTAFGVLAFSVAYLNLEPVRNVRSAEFPRRLAACVGLSLYVAQFSSFFNFFQLTEFDDIVLARNGNDASYRLDLGRPIEWICTCPLLQLALVLLGGSKIPYYRMFLMPGLALSLLILGVISTLVANEVAAIAVYVLSSITFGIQVFFNKKQITEATDGQEGLFSGRSLYRAISVLVIVTWIPFPLWYLFSPEGFNIIQDAVIVEIGWATLNIIAKFSFIILVHKLNRKFVNEQNELRSAFDNDKNSKDFKPMILKAASSHAIGLKELCSETLSFLGLQHRHDLFMKRLALAKVNSVDDMINMCSEQFCTERSIPWELARACQFRFYAKLDEGTKDGVTDAQLRAAGSSDDASARERLLEAMLGCSPQAIELAKQAAARADVNAALLSQADARCQELDHQKLVCDFVQKTLRKLLEGSDAQAIETALAAAKATSADTRELEKTATERLKHLKQKATNLRQFLKKGNEFMKNKEYDSALQQYSNGLELEPYHEKLLLNRCAAHKALRQWEAVLVDARTVTAALPTSVKARANVVEALQELGESKEALRECKVGMQMESGESSIFEALEANIRANSSSEFTASTSQDTTDTQTHFPDPAMFVLDDTIVVEVV